MEPKKTKSGFSSFSYLNAPSGEKIRVKGAQTDGFVAKSKEQITVNRYTPRQHKGAEYVHQFKAEEDAKYLESVRSKPTREDVTCDESGSSKMHQLEELTSVGTVPNLASLDREQDTKVYQFYNFASVEPEAHLRPIHCDRNRILGMIASNPVVVIKGPTGCGKSTQIPQFILDHFAEKKVYCNIVVTQPRRIAAVTIGEHICRQRNWELGQLVGYQVALDKKTSEDTRLLYCTTGVLLEKLIHDKNLNNFTHIILDEVHEREEDMDFVMLIVKKFLRSNSPNVRVVLMSATLDAWSFAKYFATVTKNGTLTAPCFEIEPKRQFEVLVYYLESLSQDAKKLPPSFEKADPNCYEDLYSLVAFMLESFNRIDQADFDMKKSSEQRAAVLIFLPGLYQIESLHEFLSKEDQMKNYALNLWLCPLHSSITRDEQEKVRKYPPEGKRKVILSTNIAESSITIPDVKYVIDFCLTKHLVSDPVTGFSSLQLAWASHTNCIQREGRVGRVQDGRVYRLVPLRFYEDEMDRACLPEMQRCPLEAIVLKCKKLMEDHCPLQLISSALDPPDLSNYEKTILKLKEIGALLTTCRGELDPQDGDLTFIGLVMGSLPLDIHITKLILLGHIFDVLVESIIMGCAMSVRNIFSEPFKERMESYNNKLIWADTSESDPISFLNVYQNWRQLIGSGRFLRTPNSEERWGKRFLLQVRHLREVAKLEEDIRRRLRHFNIEPIVNNRVKQSWSHNEKGLILKLVLAGAFYPHYFSRKPQNQLSVEHDAVKMLSGHSPNHSVFVQNLPDPHVIYENKLKAFLKKHKVGDDIKIHGDGSKKVVIEFKDHTDAKVPGDSRLDQGKIPGDIKMAVYRAVKLRQLRIPIVIDCFQPNEIKEELEKYKKSQASNAGRVDYKPLIPLNHTTIQLQVSHVENAGRFYGHILPSSNETLCLIDSALNNPNHLQPFQQLPEVETVCAAPFEVNNMVRFYRGKIRRFIHTSTDTGADIFFIDFGNSEIVSVKDLRRIDEECQRELNNIAPVAIECVLAEVGPSLWNTEKGDWSPLASKYVTDQICNRAVFAKVFSYVDRVAALYVYLRDNRKASDKDPPILNNMLIERGFAAPKQESYLSKENHRKRREIEEQGYNPLAAKDDDSVSVHSLASSLDHLTLTPNSYRPKAYLKGPFSPLEMKLFSMIHCSSQKTVQIEWNSVNSVLLDSDSSDPHERLVVAGSIGQSADGNKLTLNHTTVLPNMHGLAALVCLLFCPTSEIRVDESFSRYTGALCGLGMNPYDNESMFPENDIEVPFDTEIDSEDLLNINKLRFWMNQRLGTFDAEDLAESRVIEIQAHVRSLILSLLKKNRTSVRVTYSSKSHSWGLIPQDKVMLPYQNSDPPEDHKCFVYKLHEGVEVVPKHDLEEIQVLYKQLVTLETYLRNQLAPRELRCPLCDTDFEYLKLLQLHLESSYHLDLRKWLMSRVVDHGLARPEVSTL